MPRPPRESKIVKPIRPEEVLKIKGQDMAKEVIETFNEFIARNWDGSRSCFKLDEIAKAVAKKLNVETGVLFENHWMDVEGIFREAGWSVDYDQPGYCESYPATYTFTKKR